MIKAVFIDIDGTLFDSNKNTSEYTRSIISKCEENSIRVILTSGRSRYITKQICDKVGADSIIISSNGANAFDFKMKNDVYSKPIKNNILRSIYDYAIHNDYVIALNYGTDLAANKKRNMYDDNNDVIKSNDEIINIINSGSVVQCVVSSSDITKIRTFKNDFYSNFYGVKIENESPKIENDMAPNMETYYCDIADENISKGKAVEAVCKYLNLEKEEVAAIGDGYNDISMLKIVGNAIAMGNAVDDVKEIANVVIDTNDNDGVAKFLETLIK